MAATVSNVPDTTVNPKGRIFVTPIAIAAMANATVMHQTRWFSQN
jgi:hypothetical protein